MDTKHITVTPHEICVLQPEGDVRTISATVIIGRIALDQRHAELSDACIDATVADDIIDIGDVGTVRLAGDLHTAHRAPIEEWRAQVDAFLAGHGISTTGASHVALTCSAVAFHHDLSLHPGNVFCVTWLGPEESLDLVFAHLNMRVPLLLGTVVVFDAGQPHAVIDRQATAYAPADYASHPLCTCLSVDLSARNATVQQAMSISFASAEDAPLLVHAAGNRDLDEKTGSWRIPARRRHPTHLAVHA